MRNCLVGTRAGIIVAQNGKSGVPATRVFVLFNDDNANESDAGWFDVHAVLPTSVATVTF